MSSEWILASAYCIISDASDYAIQYGLTKIDHSGNDRTNVIDIEKIILHEDYFLIFEPFHIEYDIALLKLKSHIDMGEIENRVKLPVRNQHFPTGTSSVAIGWGMTDPETEIYSEILQKVTLDVFTVEDCQVPYATINRTVVYKSICAGVMSGGRGS